MLMCSFLLTEKVEKISENLRYCEYMAKRVQDGKGDEAGCVAMNFDPGCFFVPYFVFYLFHVEAASRCNS